MESSQRKMELYEQLLMEIQDGLQAVRDEQSGIDQVSYIKSLPVHLVGYCTAVDH